MAMPILPDDFSWQSYIDFDIKSPMKPLTFLADSLKIVSEFPEVVCSEAGFQLYQVQLGKQPEDFKPFPTIGPGVEELRIRDEGGIYRVIYVARFADAVYVLHAFQKKTQKTAQPDIEIARNRYRELAAEQERKKVEARKRARRGAARKEE